MTLCAVTSTAAAQADIREIAYYLGSHNPQAALRLAVELIDTTRLIAEFPDVGHVLEGFDPPILGFRVSQRFRKYLIFYRRLDAATVEVVRVLHGARDYGTML
jgi:toxin ParE1/3/4